MMEPHKGLPATDDSRKYLPSPTELDTANQTHISATASLRGLR